MADRLQLMVEAEKRGILPPDKAALLAEARKRGLLGGEPVAPPVETVGGMGGANPMLGRLSGMLNDGGRNIGLTPDNVASPAQNALGPLELLAQGASAAVATPIAGLAGIGQGVANLFSDGTSAANRVEQVQKALTYEPRTGAGVLLSRAATAPAELLSAGTTKAGEKVAEITGSPAAGALVKTAGDIAPAVMGARMTRRPAEPRRTGDYQRREADPVPTTQELSSAAKRAYSDAKNSGVVVPSASYDRALGRINTVINDEGINKTLHPKTAAVLKQLEESKGKDLSITEAENLRRVIQEVAGDLDPVTRRPTADAFRAGKILDEFDDAIDQLAINSDARSLWSRSRKSQMLDDMIERAGVRAGAHYTQAGMEHALRQEFKQLAMNPRRMRGFTKEQKAAIKKVAIGGPVENTLRMLGKFDPTGSVVSAAGGLVTGGMLAPITGGASMALPAVGFGAKRLATRATAKNVEAAREAIVGRGMPNAAPRATAPTTQGRVTAGAGARRARSPDAIQADIDGLLTEAQAIAKDDPLAKLKMARIRMRTAMLEAEMAEMQIAR